MWRATSASGTRPWNRTPLVGQAQLGRPGLEGRPLRAVTDDRAARRHPPFAEEGDGLEEEVDALLVDQPADEGDLGAIRHRLRGGDRFDVDAVAGHGHPWVVGHGPSRAR